MITELPIINFTINNPETTSSDGCSLNTWTYDGNGAITFFSVAFVYVKQYKEIKLQTLSPGLQHQSGAIDKLTVDDFEFRYGDQIIGWEGTIGWLDTPNSIGIEGDRVVIEAKRKPIVFVVKNNITSEVTLFRVNPTKTEMKKVFKAYADKERINPTATVIFFMFAGREVQPDDTAESLGLVENGVIECWISTLGDYNMMAVLANDLSTNNVLAHIFGYLVDPKEIFRQRRVCNKWNEAVEQATSLLVEFHVDSVENYNVMNVMATGLRNLQQISICSLKHDQHKYRDGEDPDEESATGMMANRVSHDIEIISNFRKLRELYIDKAPLNGRYPLLFNSFPLLQKLSIVGCDHLKWDLGMLSGVPVLKELVVFNNHRMTGNISTLRVLKDFLEKVRIEDCDNVEGNFMDLADFPHLKELNLEGTAVTGDIRDIGQNDFLALESLDLTTYDLQRISDAPDLIGAVYNFIKQRPALSVNLFENWLGELSPDSPDWYGQIDEETPPFFIGFVQAGPRIGYRWETREHLDGTWKVTRACEVNWLEPEPESGSSGYEAYLADCRRIQNQVFLYSGYHIPPTEEEHIRLEFGSD